MGETTQQGTCADLSARSQAMTPGSVSPTCTLPTNVPVGFAPHLALLPKGQNGEMN